MPAFLLHSRAVTVYTLGHSTAGARGRSSRCSRPRHRAASPTCAGSRPRGAIRTSRARRSRARSPPAGLTLRLVAGARRPAAGAGPTRRTSRGASASFRGLRRSHGHAGVPRRAGGARSTLAAARPTAVLCAEAVPWRCHRQLIADALVARGVDGAARRSAPGRAEPHALSRLARLEGERVVYDVGQLALGTRVAAPRERSCHNPAPSCRYDRSTS